MAKRRRLTPFDPEAAPPGAPGAPPQAPSEAQPEAPLQAPPRARAPVALVAGEASARAALEALADEMVAARATGRMVQPVPLERIDPDHLVRDRMEVDEDEMAALAASLRARGQQMPIEVVTLPGERFGLISGWRRLEALRRLHAETGEARFATALAFLRSPETAAEAYLAMVEENEIRAGISFYERARLASEAARIGVHADVPRAIAALYAGASASRRSKIASFAAVHAALGAALRFGPAIPERLGLALAAALREDGVAARLQAMLRDAAPADAAAERAVLERALREARRPPRSSPKALPRASRGEELAPGLFLDARAGQAVLSGAGLDAATLAALRDWLRRRGREAGPGTWG